PEPSPEKTSPSSGRLEARIRSLENELAELANATRQPVNEFEDPLTNQSDSNLSPNSIGNTPTKLEQQLRDLGVLEHFRKQKAKLLEARSLVLDTERDQWERVKTLSSLRDGGEIDDEIVSSMMPLWTASLEDPKGGYLRWQLLENLRGTTNGEFRSNILEWIGEEESSKMRGQALETLAPMASDPNVTEWLEYLAENDSEPRIQERALGILGNNNEGK
ncbi:hypothetical protein N9013_05550, partial [Akkermansiaceae bacterium]|nr:hypothetical protein [Akkermansiaceae bacterium]